MTGEKKSSDISRRLGVKRSGRLSTRTSKPPSSTISAPPKAQIASAKAKKDEVQRRKNPFNEMLLHRSGKEKDKENGRSKSSTPDDREHELQQTGGSSRGSLESPQDMKALERIAELERAVTLAREEQNSMREELEKLQHHGQVYRATIEDYRRQLAGTYSQTLSPPGAYNNSPRSTSPIQDLTQMDYESDVRPRRSSDHQREDLMEQNFALRSKLADLQEQLLSQDAMYQAKLEQVTGSGDDWNELTSRLHMTEKESQERLQQLLSLKSSISSLTRMDAQITDSELSESLSQLANRVREWVISNFRRTKLDFNDIPSETTKALEAISLDYKRIDSSDRLALYQAVISSAMMHLFRESIAIGLPETGPLAPIRQLAAYIHGAGADFREWRRITIRSLEKTEAKSTLQQEKEKLLHRLAGDIGHQLFTLTSVNLTPYAQSALFNILSAAADLQHTLLLQKAQYKMQFFRKAEGREIDFDDERMESMNDLDDETDEDGDIFTERKFLFCVFPCLEKFGDEYGEHADVRNILLKARVCCGVG